MPNTETGSQKRETSGTIYYIHTGIAKQAGLDCCSSVDRVAHTQKRLCQTVVS